MTLAMPFALTEQMMMIRRDAEASATQEYLKNVAARGDELVAKLENTIRQLGNVRNTRKYTVQDNIMFVRGQYGAVLKPIDSRVTLGIELTCQLRAGKWENFNGYLFRLRR